MMSRRNGDAIRFVNKDKTTPSTTKINVLNRKDTERAITSERFINDQYFPANDFILKEKIPKVRRYKLQNFGQIARAVRMASNVTNVPNITVRENFTKWNPIANTAYQDTQQTMPTVMFTKIGKDRLLAKTCCRSEELKRYTTFLY